MKKKTTGYVRGIKKAINIADWAGIFPQNLIEWGRIKIKLHYFESWLAFPIANHV